MEQNEISVEKFFSDLDTDGNGHVDRAEFISFIK